MVLIREHAPQIALFVIATDPLPSDFIPRVIFTATSQSEVENVSLVHVEDPSVAGWSYERIGGLVAERFHRKESPLASRVFVVVEDLSARGDFLTVVSLVPDSVENHGERGQVDVEGIARVGPEMAVEGPSMIQSDIKGIGFLQEGAECGGGIFRKDPVATEQAGQGSERMTGRVQKLLDDL